MHRHVTWKLLVKRFHGAQSSSAGMIFNRGLFSQIEYPTERGVCKNGLHSLVASSSNIRGQGLLQLKAYDATSGRDSNWEFLLLSSKSKFSTSAQSSSESISGIIQVPLAQTGEGIADCELISWFVKEGDEVDEFQPLCSVQSDKATIQITSRYKGKVSRLNFVPGDIIKVGESLLELVDENYTHTDSNEETLNKENSSTHIEPDVHHLDESPCKKILATPAVRHLAQSYGVKLEDIQGTGKDGRILKEDLEKYLGNMKDLKELLSVTSTEVRPPQDVKENMPQQIENLYEDKILHLKGYQRIMAKTMSAAAVIPHFYLVEEFNLDALIKLKNSLKESFEEQGLKLTFLPLMIKALSVALIKYPLVNSTCNEDASEVCYRGPHNVGVAVATPYGLAVPNIKCVQNMSIFEIAKELSRLTELAKANQLTSGDVSGGTISVSNFGAIGGKMGYPILNLPEVAIGAFGRIHKSPCIAEDGSVYPASLMNVTWAADHRVLDGATLVNFCNEWKTLIEHPERLLIHLK